MARKQIVITDFSGGVSDYIRQQRGDTFAIARHFDVFSTPNRMAPFKDAESAYASQSTVQHRTFLNYDNKLWALGVVPSSGKARIDYYTPYDQPTVTSPTNGEDSGGTTGFLLFVQYKGVIYGTAAGTRIWSYNFATTTFTASARGIGATSMGIVHSKSDTMYFGTGTNGNVVASLNQTTWTDAALTLPSDYTIVSFCEYGNFLAIGCKPVSGTGRTSKVFLWDMVSPDVSEILDFHGGDLQLIETLGTTIVGVSKYESANSSFPSKIIFKRYDGSSVKTWKTINTFGAPFVVGQQKQNDRIYFCMYATSYPRVDDYDYVGVWAIAINQAGELAVNLEYVPTNTAFAAQQVRGFFIIQDFAYISYIDTGGTWGITKTNDQSSYFLQYPTYISQIYNGGDSALLKKVVGVSVMCEPIPSGGQYSVYYRKDSETTWTLIATNTTADSIGKEHINIESTQKNLPECKEIQFKIESYRGVVITGFKCVYDEKKTLLQIK